MRRLLQPRSNDNTDGIVSVHDVAVAAGEEARVTDSIAEKL